jgi:hypothetical protein
MLRPRRATNGGARVQSGAIVVRHHPLTASLSFVRHDLEGVTELCRGASDP